MTNKTAEELLTNVIGSAARIKRSFDYHYDQMQREILQEISSLPEEEQGIIYDAFTSYMEEVMNWPTQHTTVSGFIKTITKTI